MSTDAPRTTSTAAFVQHLMRQTPRLAYPPDMPADDLPAWRSEVRDRLLTLLDFPEVAKQPPPKLLASEPRDGYRLERWEFYPESYVALPILVLVPDSATADYPAPAVMCFPGSQQPKEALCGEPWEHVSDWTNMYGQTNYMAQNLVRAGYVAVAMDNPGTAELADPELPNWQRQAPHLIMLGRSYESLSVFYRQRVLDWLTTRDCVDAARIATCGHSLGAKPALLLAVIDDRIAAVVWNDHASSWREQWIHTRMTPVAPWHYIPGFGQWFDYIDLSCALAPTPLLVTEGGRLPCHRRIADAYAKAGAADHFTVSFMPNFQDPAKRRDGEMPENLSAEEYALWANYDGDHYVKTDVILPWLEQHLIG